MRLPKIIYSYQIKTGPLFIKTASNVTLRPLILLCFTCHVVYVWSQERKVTLVAEGIKTKIREKDREKTESLRVMGGASYMSYILHFKGDCITYNYTRVI